MLAVKSYVYSIKHVVFIYLIVNPANNTVAGIVYNENMTQKILGYMQFEIRQSVDYFGSWIRGV